MAGNLKNARCGKKRPWSFLNSGKFAIFAPLIIEKRNYNIKL